MNIQLRLLKESDAHTSVAWRNIPEIWTFTDFKATRKITLEDEQAWIKRVMADPTSRRYAILADDTYVGNVYITDIEHEAGEFHIFIGDKNYWGKGVARAASSQILALARDELKLRTINLGVNPANVAALSLYKSLGFKETGTDRQFTRMSLDLARNEEDK